MEVLEEGKGGKHPPGVGGAEAGAEAGVGTGAGVGAGVGAGAGVVTRTVQVVGVPTALISWRLSTFLIPGGRYPAKLEWHWMRLI